MEVELVAHDLIKPSFPTPHLLKTHNLSLIDKFAAISQFRIDLVYPFFTHDPVEKRTLALTQYLSQTLKHFTSDDLDLITFTSWYKLGTYGIDFGWEKPVRCGPLGLGKSVKIPVAFDCLIVPVDTRIGKGVEAMVMLEEQDMKLLQRDQKLFIICCRRSHALAD